VKELLDILGKQRLHQMTSGSNSGDSGGVDTGKMHGVAAASVGVGEEEAHRRDVREEEEEARRRRRRRRMTMTMMMMRRRRGMEGERAGARRRAKERVMESPMERGLLLNFSLKRNNLMSGSLIFPIKFLTKRERTRERARKKDREGGRPKQTGLYEYTYCVYNVLSRARPRPLAEDTLRLSLEFQGHPKVPRLDARVSAPAPRILTHKGAWEFIPVAELGLGINYEWQSSQ